MPNHLLRHDEYGGLDTYTFDNEPSTTEQGFTAFTSTDLALLLSMYVSVIMLLMGVAIHLCTIVNHIKYVSTNTDILVDGFAFTREESLMDRLRRFSIAVHGPKKPIVRDPQDDKDDYETATIIS